MTLLYTEKPCGCLVLVLVNDAANIRYCAKDLARELREGRAPKECAKTDLPPLKCPEHRAKPQPEQQAMGLR